MSLLWGGKMKFEDKFKPGDIICSDCFHDGLCMIVEDVGIAMLWGGNDFRYKCEDLVKEGQGWCAFEFDSMFDKPYNWRIATDDDIAKYLSRFLDLPVGVVGDWYLAKLTDDGIMLEDRMFTNKDIWFDAKELADLKRIIDERLG
jgi:hypothetical protein